MPVDFGPPECVVITDHSSVAAGGIASVSPPSHTRGKLPRGYLSEFILSVAKESSLWLSHPVSSEIVPFPFGFGHQSRRYVGISAYAQSPAFCCLDFPKGMEGVAFDIPLERPDANVRSNYTINNRKKTPRSKIDRVFFRE